MSLLPCATYAGPSQAEAIWAVAGSVGPGGGVTQLLAGTNITLEPPTGEGVVTINALGGGGAGVTSVTAGSAGISATPTTGAVVIENTGVTSLVAGTGIGLSGTTGAVTISNTGASVVPGYAEFNWSATGANVFNVGSCGMVSFGTVDGTAIFTNSGGALLNGFKLINNNAFPITLVNPSWNANTIVLANFSQETQAVGGGGVSICALNIFVTTPSDPTQRRVLLTGVGPVPTGAVIPYALKFVAFQTIA